MLAQPETPPADPKADFKSGIVAYRQGDYDVALKKWIPLAKDGAVEAQVNLGIMCAKGQGVDKDPGEADQPAMP